MNTSSYSRGDAFELKTFNLLKTVLENDDFFVSGKKSKIFRKKKYPSNRREGGIIFDITIETYQNNSDTYSLLTVIECKNYSKPVPVNDLEEFSGKLEQVGYHNVKGVLITNHSFQSGSYQYAKSSGIALARVKDNDEFEWIVNRREPSSGALTIQEAVALLEEEPETPSTLDFVATNDNFALPTFSELLLQMQIIDVFKQKEKFIRVPFVSKERIDEIINRIEKYDVYKNKMLDEEKVCRFLKEKYGVEFDFDTQLEPGILGKINFNRLCIQISKDLRKDLPRWRFTLAHEIGHLILHLNLLKHKLSEKTDTELSLSFQYFVSEVSTRRLEYQANLFAGNLLLPASTLDVVVKGFFADEHIHKGHLYWDHQPVNQQTVFRLLTKLSDVYGVSMEVARIRLIALGLLIDDRYKKVRDVLKEMQLL